MRSVGSAAVMFDPLRIKAPGERVRSSWLQLDRMLALPCSVFLHPEYDYVSCS
jgi:hypothetical protein